MKNLPATLYLSIAIFLCGTSGAFAWCLQNPKDCITESVLCDRATEGYIYTGNKRWSSHPSVQGHVKLAKRRGLSCDVGISEREYEQCFDDPLQCSDKMICDLSVIQRADDFGRIGWFDPKYANDAQRRGLTCKVGEPALSELVLQGFMKRFSTKQIQKIQTALQRNGLFDSGIDGVYGQITENAIFAYSRYHQSGLHVGNPDNVISLFNRLLNPDVLPAIDSDRILKEAEFEYFIKTKPAKRQIIIEEPVVVSIPEEKPKRDLEKEFEISFYGSFLHSERVPNALFFLDEIKQNDRFEFRKALRNHDIDLIVLSSPGGSVWEGLSMAGIIHDKELNTYIPKINDIDEGDCASACSFMFFAGETRIVEGKLGVHQFYSGNGSKKEKIEEVQEGTQFTVSEIIGFLNEFETPSWVFERMFQQSEMYYFKEKELVKLETEVPDDIKANFKMSEKFINELSEAINERKN